MGKIEKIWEYDVSQRQSGGLGPLIADINNDGKMEIIVAGDNQPDADFIFVLKADGTLLWKTQLQYSIVGHNPIETFDLDGDGKLEIIVPGPNAMQVLKSDGTLYWKNTSIKTSESHIVVVEIDNYPYIFCSDASSTGTATLKKVDGRTGTIIKHVSSWYPCHGGLSAGIVKGNLRLFMSDRNFGAGAKGIQSYDTELNLLWSRPEIGCSSHLPVLVDMNGDGELEVVISQQRNPGAGIYCINADTGQNIPGKFQDNIPDLNVHETFPVHNIKEDDTFYLITSCYSPVVVFNLKTWQKVATLGYCGKGPSIAKVFDNKWNIILADEVSTIRIYDTNFTEIITLNEPSYGATVQDIDNDGFNELIITSPLGVVKAFKTTGITDTLKPNAGICYYSTHHARTATYIPSIPIPTDVFTLSVEINLFKNQVSTPIYNEDIDITNIVKIKT